MAKRNNRSRTAKAAANPMMAPPESPLSYTNPTEFVELPTKGLLYPEEHPFHGKDEVEIRYMTAKDEDILSSLTLIQKGIAVDRFVQNILIENVDVDSLFAGYKNAIIVAARATGYGPDYTCSVSCPACGARSEHTFNLNELPIKEVPDGIEFTPDGTFLIELPKTGFTAELRLLTAKEQKYLNRLAESKKKNNLRESGSTDLLKMIIVSVGQVTDRAEVEKFIDNMPSMDSLAIRRLYSSITPDIDMKQDFDCPSCGTTTALAVPLGSDFFWPQ